MKYLAKAKLDRREYKEFLALVDKADSGLRRAFERGILKLRNNIDLQEFERLIAARRIPEALSIVNREFIERGFDDFNDVLEQSYQAGGVFAARTAAASGLVTRFNMLNPGTASYLNKYRASRILELTKETRRSVEGIIRSSIVAGQNPMATAREVKRLVGLTEKQADAVRNYRTLLETGDLTALNRALRDKRFDGTLRAAVRDGKGIPAGKINTMVDAYERKYIKYRAETIARTESIRVLSAGRQQLWEQMQEEGKVQAGEIRRFWVPTYDARLRDAHAAIPGMNPEGVGMNEPFQSPLGPIMFPGDPDADPANTINCRCYDFIRIV